ncbi:Long-chain-fatty-acid--CoA ligase 6 [Geranomyces variabilis]|uniref:Long-chain-fatty-acid--CoA ligase 6 n=1 Tax=Geranomyces variabilis TaxID=109894 RepID=A0AAD5XRB1_9FUNG|nr:Long-chain-fatty-acid--CoA ligase 6 [Geranomyces variabilis]
MTVEISTVTVLLASAVGAALLSSYLFAVTPTFHPAKFRQQSVRTKTRKEGESAIIRNPITPHDSKLIDAFPGNVNTAYEMLWSAVNKYGSREYLAHRVGGSWAWQSFSAMGDRAKAFGSGLQEIAGLAAPNQKQEFPLSSQMVGLFLVGCPEWIVADFACVTYNLVSVPLYDTFDADALKHIITKTEMSVLITSEKNANKALDMVGSCPSLKYIVIANVTTIAGDMAERAKATNVQLRTFKEVETVGKSNVREPVRPTPDDVFTMCATSGTTGPPKIAMITHRNLTTGGAGMCATLPEGYQLGDSDRHLSYLPLSHMFERICFWSLTHLGARIGFFGGSIPQLFDDVASFRPTLFPTVPRLLGRLYDKINITIDQSNIVKRTVFKVAFAAKRRMLHQGCVTNSSIWDKIFGPIQAKIGGNVKVILTGAAPISPEILEFVRIVLGAETLEGYGQTESSAAGFVTAVGDYQYPFGSHVGVPFPSAECKLLDVAPMNYFSTDKPNPRGEILIRGPLVMKGYFKEPKLTAEAIDADGWLHTGDVGALVANGTLKIIDRAKAIFKLSNGEYISPEPIEGKIKATYALQVYVYGDSLQSSLVAIVVPDPESFPAWAADKGFNGSLEDACKDENLRKAVLADLQALGKKGGLHGFEIPARVKLCAEPMSVENGLLTPTFKTKRNVARDHFRADIDKMYKEISGK